MSITDLLVARRELLQAMILIIVAVVFGGGGSGAGICNLIVQLTALTIIAVNPKALLSFFARAPRFLAWLVAAVLLLPVLQCIPLPQFVWQSLPGRSLVSASFALIGQSNSFFPTSLNVGRTIIAFLSLMPALAILVLTWFLSETEKRQLLRLLVVLAVFVVLLGAVQLSTGNRNYIFFAETYGSGNLQGTFANRNSAALFFDVSLCALIGILPSRRMRTVKILAFAALALLIVVGLVLTRSRSGMVLASVPASFLLHRLWRPDILRKITWRKTCILFIVSVILVCGAAIVVDRNQRLQMSVSRFSNYQDVRPLIWADTLGAIQRFWPIGSGIGTFDEVFQIDESLENLGPGRAARAHNDYLETALESGFPGVVLLGCWAIFLITNGRCAITRGGIATLPVSVFALLALQSILDYPLRNQTMLCVAGMAIALLIEVPFAGKRERRAKETEVGNSLI